MTKQEGSGEGSFIFAMEGMRENVLVFKEEILLEKDWYNNLVKLTNLTAIPGLTSYALYQIHRNMEFEWRHGMVDFRAEVREVQPLPPVLETQASKPPSGVILLTDGHHEREK